VQGWSGFDADLAQQTPNTLQLFRVMLFTCVTVMTLAALIFAILIPLRHKDVDDAQAELARLRKTDGEMKTEIG
jgi:Na+/melibiose symporter-like transporter